MRPRTTTILLLTGPLLWTAGCVPRKVRIANQIRANHRANEAERARQAAERRDDHTRWEKVGERVVDGRGDDDSIAVAAHERAFTSIQLVVEHGALELWDVEVTFRDGTSFSPGTRVVFDRKTSSLAIDLPGDAPRTIRRVAFRHGGGHARLELWAR